MKIVVEIPAGSQICGTCQFSEGMGLYCQLFHQERHESSGLKLRLQACNQAEEEYDSLKK
jgi:hypothetical protein